MIKNILFVDLLIDRGLIDKAKKYIKRVKEYAYRYEEFSLIFLIIEIEESLFFEHGYIVNRTDLRKLNEERLKIHELINNLTEFRILKAEIQELQLDDNYLLMTIEDYYKIPQYALLISEEKALSQKAKNLWSYLNALIFYFVRDYKSALLMIEKQYQYYHLNTTIFTRDDYLQMLNNYLLFCCRAKNDKKFYQIINELDSLSDKNKKDEVYIKTVKYYRTLELHYCLEEFDSAFKLAKEAEEYIESNSDRIEPFDIKYLQMLIIRAYINFGQYENANRYLQIRYLTKGFAYNELLAKLFEFITQYKLGNTHILEYSVNSWSKITQTKRKLYKAEKILFSFFRMIDYATSSDSKKELLIKTSNKLKEIEKNSSENFIFEDFDFIRWFEVELNKI